ncbi:MAG: universal stress protein [Deltaproteobacteria bacterium]|nr:universal stress protein [Deltaproteobacteria bacterium]
MTRPEGEHIALEEILIEMFTAEVGAPGAARVPAIGRVLVPTDFSPLSLRALPYAEEMARRFDAELLVLYVDFAPSIYDPTQGDVVASKAAIERAADVLRARGVRARAVYRRGAAADEIVRGAADEKADLIVLATHGRTGLAHALMGSVAESVVRRAPCPVLSVRGLASK